MEKFGKKITSYVLATESENDPGSKVNYSVISIFHYLYEDLGNQNQKLTILKFLKLHVIPIIF